MENQFSSRREFLQGAASLIGVSVLAPSFNFLANKPKLAFTTLGCPDWPFPDIVKFAAANHYEALEIRGILRELDLPKVKEFSSPQKIAETRKLMKDNHLEFSDLGASAQMHHKDPVERKKQLDDGRRFIDLAQQLGCPAVRVFPNNLPKDMEKDAAIELIASGLHELAVYAQPSGVKVLMETHGEMTQTGDIVKTMELAKHKLVGLVWDVVNMWSVTRESPSLVYPKIKTYIHHTHIKDAKFVDGKLKYVLLGEGEAPIFEAIDLLIKGGYNKYYSFEWEKLWHPEIEAPEVALAQFARTMLQKYP